MNVTTRRALSQLHEAGCFVMPNPWDVGSARYLQHLGFPALATTSAGFAFSQGLPDSDVALSRDRNLAHIADLAEAGADVLFAPGVHDRREIAALVDAVRSKPLNLLVARNIGLSVADIAALGVRRISLGPALALAAWTGFRRAAQALRADGSFAGLEALVPFSDINGFFTTDYAHRG